jgi:integrase
MIISGFTLVPLTLLRKVSPSQVRAVLAELDTRRYPLRDRVMFMLSLKAGMRAKKPKYGMHSLRHAAASLFIEQGFSPKRIQALMGHSTIQMTFDTYGHLFPAADDDRVAMGQLQARLVG